MARWVVLVKRIDVLCRYLVSYASFFHGDGPPHVITYSDPISASPTGQRLHQALALLATMQTARLSPHVITYAAPMSPCPKCQRLHQALAPLVTVQTARSLPLSPPTPLPSVLARGPGIGTGHSAFWP